MLSDDILYAQNWPGHSPGFLRHFRLFSSPFYSRSAMFRTILNFAGKWRLACFGGLAAGLLCLVASGCSRWALRGESFPDDSMSATIRQSRPPANNAEFWGFSNKARQIEADCGAQ
jgi:hypothetical protein